LKFQQNSHAPKESYLIGVITIVVFAFICGLLIYPPIAQIEISYFIFENLSLSKVVGDWSNITKFCLSFVFSVLTGVCYHISMKVWKLPAIVSVPTAFLLSIISFVIFMVAIIVISSILAMIIGILALFFFNPGDR